MNLTTHITEYINAGFAGIWVQTWEPEEAQKQINELAHENQWTAVRWDLAAGTSTKPPKAQGDPVAALKFLRAMESEGENHRNILTLHNFHRLLSQPMILQELYNTVYEGKANGNFDIVLAP